MTSVIVGANGKMLNLMPWRNGRLTFLKFIHTRILFTLVIHIFFPLNLHLLFVILNEVSRIFIWTIFLADKGANNILVVWRLYYFDTLKRECIDSNAYKLQPSLSERVIVDGHGCHTALHFGVKAKGNQYRVPTLYWLLQLHKTLWSKVNC